ncbi:hypothetical protein Trydic_g12597 [Trypoxylus dichotomus]
MYTQIWYIIGCCVKFCRERGKNVKFHRIPIADSKLCQIWFSRIGSDNLFMKDAKTLGNYQICHKHFDDMCKIETKAGLKPFSIPILHLPKVPS